MDSIAIVGGATLNGEIPISGAKNSAIKLMVASLLTDEPLRLTNMPRLADTRFLGKLMQHLGTRIEERDGEAGPETLLRGLKSPVGVAVDGTHVFVANKGHGEILVVPKNGVDGVVTYPER